VRRLAMWQRRLSWGVLAIGLNLLLLILVPSKPTASTIGTILLGAVTFAWCLNIVLLLIAAAGVLGAINVRRTTIAILILALLVPPTSGFALLIADILALRQLRRAGLRIGFFGIKDEEVVRVLSAALCGQCGYNLTGNVSGRCPECGTPVPQPPLVQPVG